MFEAIRDLTEKVKQLDEGVILNKLIANAEVRKFIIDLNTKDQLFIKGVDSNNVGLGLYAPSTVQSKIDRGIPVPSDSHITLFDTGEFYSTFVIIPGKDFFEIDANPIREDTDLFKEYGEEIVGLNDENLQKVIDLFRETISLRVREQLGLL